MCLSPKSLTSSTIKSKTVHAHWVSICVTSHALALNYNSQIFDLNSKWPFNCVVCPCHYSLQQVFRITVAFKSLSHRTVPSKCVNKIELIEDNGGQAWTVPTITTYSDVYPDNSSILRLEKLTSYFAREDIFLLLFKIRKKKSSPWCSSLYLKMSL